MLTKHSEIKNQEKIRNFLNPPNHKKEDGREIKLTQQQKELIEHVPNSWKRVRGVAGAGKTIVITQKAANVASCGKKVLIVCFNKTLKAYIRDNIDKAKKDFDWNLIECHHFHEFIKIFIEENDLEIKNRGQKFELYERELLAKAQALIERKENIKTREYDAILIDEAQDFKKEWFDLLLNFLSSNDEILLVADDRQNIYDREISWINESMSGYGYKFKGIWGTLKDNIRQKEMPEVIEESNLFFNLFLKDYFSLYPEKSFGNSLETQKLKKKFFSRLFNSVELFWKNIHKDQLGESFLSAYRWLIKQGYYPQDIVVLVLTRKRGRELKELLDLEQVKSEKILNSREKKEFLSDVESLKIMTVHSFKGLENGVIIFISDGKEDALGDFETYVAITRATECLIVLNTKDKYKDYGETWKKYL